MGRGLPSISVVGAPVDVPAPSPSAPLAPLTLSDAEMTQTVNVNGLVARVHPATFTTPVQKSTQVTIVGNQTGATTTVMIVVNKSNIGDTQQGPSGG